MTERGDIALVLDRHLGVEQAADCALLVPGGRHASLTACNASLKSAYRVRTCWPAPNPDPR
jgi:hypothetical protein